jgi:hypothetical protein
MKRETITIDKYSLNVILGELRGADEELANPEEVDKYELVELILNSADAEDGGKDYTAILKRKEDGKFFSLDFLEWDIWWEYSSDFDSMPEELEEVFPEVITTTIYK